MARNCTTVVEICKHNPLFIAVTQYSSNNSIRRRTTMAIHTAYTYYKIALEKYNNDRFSQPIAAPFVDYFHYEVRMLLTKEEAADLLSYIMDVLELY